MINSLKFHLETNHPKRPMSSYMLFVKEQMDQRGNTVSSKAEATTFVTEAGQKWRSMTDEEKKVSK